MVWSFEKHYKAFGEKKGRSRKQWQSKYDKYLAEHAAADSAVDDAEEEIYTMSPPQNFQNADPEDPEDLIERETNANKQFRQINERTGTAVVTVLRPVIRNTTGRNLLGTSGDTIESELVEE